jgi:pyruvate dehydrogenase (quinone)
MAKTVGAYLVEMMSKAGVWNVYGIVGDSANPIIDAIRCSEGKLNFVNVRNEEAGVFAAGADSQASERPVALLGSSGPGSLHLVNGLYDCARNGATVFAMATHIPSTEIGTRYFQETRPDQIFLDCGKHIRYVTSSTCTFNASKSAVRTGARLRAVDGQAGF